MKRKEGRTVERIAEEQEQNKENEVMSIRGSLKARTSERMLVRRVRSTVLHACRDSEAGDRSTPCETVAEFRSFVCDKAP